MPERQFYKTVVTIEVLSEEPYEENDLANIAYDIDAGDYVGSVSVGESVAVDGKTMAALLAAAGSDPGFFSLDTDGVHEDDREEDDDDE